MTVAPDPASVHRRIGRLRQRLAGRAADDPDVQAALAELADLAARVAEEAARAEAAQEAAAAEQRRLRAERRRSQLLFHIAPAVCLFTDVNGLVQHANPSARAMFRGRELEGRPVVLHFAPGDRARVHAMATAAAGGRMETAVLTLAGDEQEPVRLEVRCVLASEDQLLWLGRDVTEQEAARGRLEDAMASEHAAAEKLRDLDEVRDAFILAVSHDLQAPIAGMAGLAGLLREQPRLPARDRRRMLDQIHATAEQLLVELRNLLDLERLHRGTVGLERRRVDVAAVVGGAAAAADLGDRQLVLEATPTEADVDPVVVRRIVGNLLANAARHTPAGTTVWIRVGREPDGILLVVEDDGPGVSYELRPRVFDLFSRDRGADGGLGVGLALVRRFAELHGGTARVEGRPGGGAAFHVLLPDG
ncbi:MAG TPA: HAMP domain-containing sensor histidine kinase [Acidimicrobiales bacterium]